MANVFIFASLMASFFGMSYGQQKTKTISADQIIKQIENNESVDYKDVIIKDDLDLTKISKRTNDSTYPENEKTARVYSLIIKKPVSFKNVIFSGKVKFFRKDINNNEINEYRTIFSEKVSFENCRFEDISDFELTNFDSDVSFKDSIFALEPLFVRIGLVKTPLFSGTKFLKGSIVKNFQYDKPLNFTSDELQNYYDTYLKAEN